MDTRSKPTFVLLGHPLLFDNMLVFPFVCLACFVCPRLALFVDVFFAYSPHLLWFFHCLSIGLFFFFVFACTRMEHGHLEQGYDFLDASKKGKDASPQRAMSSRLGAYPNPEWFSLSLFLGLFFRACIRVLLHVPHFIFLFLTWATFLR